MMMCRHIRMSTRQEIFETMATFNTNMLHSVVEEAVRKKCPNMIDIVNVAIRMGLDVNGSKLIVLAIMEHNLELFLLCIKEKAELANIGSKSLLHFAVHARN